MKFETIKRYTRSICKATGNARIINMPKEIYEIINSDHIQYIVFQNENGDKMIALCGIDGFGFARLNNILNK